MNQKMTMKRIGKTMEPVRTMDYALVVSRKGMEGSGLSVGQVVLISGTKVLPEKKNDPYVQRVYVVCVKVVDGFHQLPKEDNDYLTYLIDPRCLQKLGEEEQEEYRKCLREQYGQRG